MEYSISLLNDPSRIPELIELFRTGLGDTTVDYWRWRLFTDNGQEDRPIIVVADDEKGNMCAMSSVLPVIYGAEASKKKCIQFCDWVVHPEHRGKGIISTIYKFVISFYQGKDYDFIIEFPNECSYPIFKKFGFCEAIQVDRQVSSSRLFKSRHTPSDFTLNGIDVLFTDVCPMVNETFCRKDRIARTTAFLRWKFDQNPNASYKWVGFYQNGGYIGYVVYALVHGRLRTAVNVYDWEYPSDDAAVFKRTLRAIGGQGNFLSIWGRYNGRDQSLLEQCGLKRTSCNTRLMLKSISESGYPEDLTLTRIDTDY